jgi:hypothetical protein
MTVWLPPPATPKCPDRTSCRHCGQIIVWDDYSYTHSATGFADCGIHVTGGLPIEGSLSVRLNPKIEQDLCWAGRRAEPAEWDYYGITG